MKELYAHSANSQCLWQGLDDYLKEITGLAKNLPINLVLGKWSIQLDRGMEEYDA